MLQAQTYHFRGLEWGATRAKVKQTEKARFVLERDNFLEYQSVLGDYDATLTYYFTVEDQLMGAKYTIHNRFSNPQHHFEEFAFFESLLSEKYGTPVKRSVITPKQDPKDENLYTSLLKEGNFSQETRWETPETEVRLILSGEGDQVILTIEYFSRKLTTLNQQRKKEMVLKYL
ncbi:MAG: hypothetical protein D6714_06660 [Bacteroidetes bacterium]|nr:MAG: hypothetical protein D6714_06660 [Bacteroidota bacterium]